MYLYIAQFTVQCFAALLALLITIQGIAEVEQGLIAGIFKTLCCPVAWLYLARKMKSFYISTPLLIGGIFISVFMVPGVFGPALLRVGEPLFSSLAFVTVVSLNLWSAFHARWAQMELFNKGSAI